MSKILNNIAEEEAEKILKARNLDGIFLIAVSNKSVNILDGNAALLRAEIGRHAHATSTTGLVGLHQALNASLDIIMKDIQKELYSRGIDVNKLEDINEH